MPRIHTNTAASFASNGNRNECHSFDVPGELVRMRPRVCVNVSRKVFAYKYSDLSGARRILRVFQTHVGYPIPR